MRNKFTISSLLVLTLVLAGGVCLTVQNYRLANADGELQTQTSKVEELTQRQEYSNATKLGMSVLTKNATVSRNDKLLSFVSSIPIEKLSYQQLPSAKDSSVRLCCFFENPLADDIAVRQPVSINQVPPGGSKYAFVLVDADNNVIDYTFYKNAIGYAYAGDVDNINMPVMLATGTQINVTGNKSGFGTFSNRPSD